MKHRKLLAMVFAVAGLLGAAAGSAVPASAGQTVHGCWYEPPNPPGCDICGWDCGAGQQCCTIQ
jgi:hypothetical protein